MTQLGATPHVNALGKITRRYAMGAHGQLLNRLRQFLCEKETDDESQESGDHADPDGLPPHVAH